MGVLGPWASKLRLAKEEALEAKEIGSGLEKEALLSLLLDVFSLPKLELNDDELELFNDELSLPLRLRRDRRVKSAAVA